MYKTAILAFVAFGFLTVPASVVAQQKVAASSKTKWPECYCTDRYGKRRELGDIICLNVGGRSFEAKCVMAQNNPFWRDLERGCLSSSLPPSLLPAMNLRKNEVAALYQ